MGDSLINSNSFSQMARGNQGAILLLLALPSCTKIVHHHRKGCREKAATWISTQNTTWTSAKVQATSAPWSNPWVHTGFEASTVELDRKSFGCTPMSTATTFYFMGKSVSRMSCHCQGAFEQCVQHRTGFPTIYAGQQKEGTDSHQNNQVWEGAGKEKE